MSIEVYQFRIMQKICTEMPDIRKIRPSQMKKAKNTYFILETDELNQTFL